MFDWLAAVILGMVEGLTEFLPISSTGHMILTATLLDRTGDQWKTFEIIIQLGSILAIVVLFRERFTKLVSMGLKGEAIFPKPGVPLLTWSHIAVASIPAFILGYLFHGIIKRNLFSDQTVIVGLVLGGLFMIVAEVFAKKRGVHTLSIDEMSLKQAFAVGVTQCLSLWPGFSRSGSSIAGGLFFGMSHRTAAEFSFLIAVPIMIAASGYDLLKSYQYITADFAVVMAIGFVTAFFVAWLAVSVFLNLVQRVKLTPFAIYRFVVAFLYWFIILK